MAKTAILLMEEREKHPFAANDPAALVATLTATHLSDVQRTALNQNPDYIADVTTSLEALGEHGPFGMLERYVVESRFLDGRSREEIAEAIAAHAADLVDDLLSSALRTLRHPQYICSLSAYLK